MNSFLDLYKVLKPWIEISKDTAFFIGVIPFILAIYKTVKFLSNRKFIGTLEEMDANIRFRERLEPDLERYVLDADKAGVKDICIRFIHWKNYPSKLQDDGFKHPLRIEYFHNKLVSASWIDNMGIYFQEHLWFYGISVYVNNDGVFFLAQQNGSYRGFSEYKNGCLVMHLSFRNIVSFDFREKIDYEPVFYTKFSYKQFKKLYSPIMTLRKLTDDADFKLELDMRKQIRKYNCLSYLVMKLWIGIKKTKNELLATN